MSDSRFSPSNSERTNPYESTDPWGNVSRGQSQPPFPQPQGAPHGQQAPSPITPQYPGQSAPPVQVPRQQVPSAGATWAPGQGPYAAPSATTTPEYQGSPWGTPGPGGPWGPADASLPERRKRRWVAPTIAAIVALFFGFSLGGGDTVLLEEQNLLLQEEITVLQEENDQLWDNLYDLELENEELRLRLAQSGDSS
ncbi:hypothetical protein [Actinomyces minihominis]|uniref:hypothetical protein n=1 Tax=Actinomyces minihominis TaxID=2002838 RepID=UPI00101ADBDB|nr:hypothetical protein [Actinomyces minihominis]